MKQVKGKAHNIDRVLFGRYTLSNTPWSNDIALYCTQKPILTKGIIAYIVPEGHVFKTAKPIVEVEKLPDFRNELPHKVPLRLCGKRNQDIMHFT